MSNDLTFDRRDGFSPESSARSLRRASGVQCRRILVGWSRDPVTLLQALVYPALMVFLFWLVLGSTPNSGAPSSYGLVPMVALVGAMSGASISGLGLQRERDNGQLAKMWALPVHRSSAMVGRLCAESIRILVTVAFVLLVGAVVGFRIDTGVPGGLAVLAIALGFGLSFSVMITAFALLAGDTRIVEWTAIGTNVALFFNSGFVPVASYPSWLQPIIEYQPLSCAVDAIRAVAAGLDVTKPLLLTAAWSVGAALAFAPAAIRGYRAAVVR
ncbi:transport permease protein [Rhodococcoides trifolii]|uniref:Transport permease protein n=1 Tax=Rhodococcoides trifolii TaxID=908250 RepID=A0A917G5U6_9NOCA|nr:ABC transporter permease [Rhodococcus trifolii]GGG23290.1 transport permease protein [Rhodococcus trifolii]